MYKKNLFIIAIVVSIMVISCSKNESVTTSQSETTRTIIDGKGRTVEIPEKVNRIVPHGNAPRFITYLGLANKCVGIPECEHAKSPIMAYAYTQKNIWKDLPNVGTDSLGATEWYPEEIIACNPDVIFCTYEKDIADDMQAKTGIPVVAVKYSNLFSEEYNESLRIIADVCGVSDRAEELISYITKSLEDVKNRTKNIPNETKPTVLAAGATFKGGHSIDGIYSKYAVFEALAVNDVAKGVSDKAHGIIVDKEQIIAWNPEKIFFDASNIKLVNQDYEKDPAYFAQLQAVKNGELYQWPNSTWHYSNVEIPLVTTYYVGKLLYPKEFADINFEQKASEIFSMFLDEPNYLETLNKAGVGYKKITLGE